MKNKCYLNEEYIYLRIMYDDECGFGFKENVV